MPKKYKKEQSLGQIFSTISETHWTPPVYSNDDLRLMKKTYFEELENLKSLIKSGEITPTESARFDGLLSDEELALKYNQPLQEIIENQDRSFPWRLLPPEL